MFMTSMFIPLLRYVPNIKISSKYESRYDIMQILDKKTIIFDVILFFIVLKPDITHRNDC